MVKAGPFFRPCRDWAVVTIPLLTHHRTPLPCTVLTPQCSPLRFFLSRSEAAYFMVVCLCHVGQTATLRGVWLNTCNCLVLGSY